MKKFKCTVTREDYFEIELDENVINEEFMEDFRKYFYDYYKLEDHAKHLAQFQARFGDELFIEGYGNIMRDGTLPFTFSSEKKEPQPGINIITSKNYEEINVDVA
jgi:hypothetical protein